MDNDDLLEQVRERGDIDMTQFDECAGRWGALSAPALGALLGMVREATGRLVYAHPDGTTGRPGGWWSVATEPPIRVVGSGGSEAEALLRALLASGV